MIDDILKQRNARYGDFVSEAKIAQRLKSILTGDRPTQLSVMQRHALDMIAVKLARIVNGDPYYADNWRDIVGYCTLVLNVLEGD